MKSCTDLEQSKRLIELGLDVETSDMYYIEDSSDNPYCELYASKLNEEARKYYNIHYIPAWSLAALIGVLPQFIEFKGDKYYLRFMKEYVEYANDEVSITGRYLHTTGNNNLVDVCYEMILKLHKSNLL